MIRFRITTPEQVVFSYEIAGLTSRGVAWLVDQTCIMVTRLAIFISLAYSGQTIGVALALVLIFALDFGYFVFFELYWAGQSPGKRLTGIRVLSSRGVRLRFTDVLVRNLLRPVDMLPLVIPLGGWVALGNGLRRRLGDLGGDTMVVRDVRAAIPEGMLTQAGRVNSFQEDPVIRNRILARVTRKQRDLILDLMLRRDQLDVAAREDIFARAAGFFREKFALPQGLEHLSNEQTVLNLALVIQAGQWAD